MAPQEYEFGKKNPIVSNGERGRIERERREQMLVSWMVLSHRVTFLLMFLKDGFCFILEGIAKKEVILKNMSVVFTFRTTLKKKKRVGLKEKLSLQRCFITSLPLPLGVGVFWKFLLDSDVRF